MLVKQIDQFVSILDSWASHHDRKLLDDKLVNIIKLSLNILKKSKFYVCEHNKKY